MLPKRSTTARTSPALIGEGAFVRRCDVHTRTLVVVVVALASAPTPVIASPNDRLRHLGRRSPSGDSL